MGRVIFKWINSTIGWKKSCPIKGSFLFFLILFHDPFGLFKHSEFIAFRFVVVDDSL